MHIKQMTIIVFGVFILLFCFHQQTHAASGTLYRVNVDKIVLKAGPARDTQTIATLTRGEHVTTFENKYDWLRTFYHGQEVWVASQYLTPVKQQQAETVQKTKKHTKSTTKTTSTILRKKKNKPVQHKTGNKPLSGYTIILDAGHGGKDSGAVYGRVVEKRLTLNTALATRNSLVNAGATVRLTRNRDYFVSLGRRVNISNQAKPLLFISLHYNYFKSPNAHGITIFYNQNNQAHTMAQSVEHTLMASVPLSNRGIRTKDYFVLRNNQAPALLIELGFLTSPTDRKVIQTNTFNQQVAAGIVHGVENAVH